MSFVIKKKCTEMFKEASVITVCRNKKKSRYLFTKAKGILVWGWQAEIKFAWTNQKTNIYDMGLMLMGENVMQFRKDQSIVILLKKCSYEDCRMMWINA